MKKLVIIDFCIILLLQLTAILLFTHVSHQVYNLLTPFIDLLSAIYIFISIQKKSFFKSSFFLTNNLRTSFLILLPIIFLYSSIKNVVEIIPNQVEYSSILFLCGYSLTTALFEEFFFRLFIWGIFYTSLKSSRYSPILGVTLTSLVFALSHFTNIISEILSFEMVIKQVFFAFIIGIILQTLLIKFNNIWLVVIIHACLNISDELIQLGSKVDSSMQMINKEIKGDDFNLMELILPFVLPILISYLFSILVLRSVKSYDGYRLSSE